MDWAARCHEAAAHFEKGDFQSAAEIFAELCNRADIPQTERSYMGMNLATTYDRMGQVQQAIETYEWAVSMAMWPYSYMQESRAAYLASRGRAAEAVRILEHVLGLDLLPQERRASAESILAQARAMK